MHSKLRKRLTQLTVLKVNNDFSSDGDTTPESGVVKVKQKGEKKQRKSKTQGPTPIQGTTPLPMIREENTFREQNTIEGLLIQSKADLDEETPKFSLAAKVIASPILESDENMFDRNRMVQVSDLNDKVDDMWKKASNDKVLEE